MSAPRYPVATLAQMAEIPAEALPRFIEELPAIIEALHQIVASAPELGAAMKEKAPWPFRLLPARTFAAAVRRAGFQAMVWIDDDKKLGTVSIKISEGHEPFYSRTEPMGRGE